MTQTTAAKKTEKNNEQLDAVVEAVESRIASSEAKVAAHVASEMEATKGQIKFLARGLQQIIDGGPTPTAGLVIPASSPRPIEEGFLGLRKRPAPVKVTLTEMEALARVPSIAAHMMTGASEDPATQEVLDTAAAGLLSAAVKAAYDGGLIEAPKKPMSTAMKVGLAVGGVAVVGGLGYLGYRAYQAAQAEADEMPSSLDPEISDAELVG